MPTVIADRLLKDLYSLREFGTYKTGVHRPTYSEIDMAAREWLVGRMADAGLNAQIDGIGNVIGRSPAPGPILLSGSHLETQPYAGWLDGALGVIYGLEAARAIAEDPECQGCGVDVAAWADEEGHFKSFIGSRSFIGDLPDSEINQIDNKYDGTPLRTALTAAGLTGKPRIKADPDRYCGYFEAHIEQGDSLEASDLQIGIVTSIVAIWQFKITAEGVQNHAGTTRMAIRKDAGLALVKLAAKIDRVFRSIAAERSVWTIGDIKLEPGAGSIIPGRGEMVFQFRDADMAQLEAFEAALQQMIATANIDGPCSLTLETMAKSTPRLMDPSLQVALDAGAEIHAPGKHIRMRSGAGHDAQYLAEIMPAAMLFVPSIGGISHHWTENTHDDDIITGARTLTEATARILKAAR